jgi:large subunit ribosomal protein L25
VSTDRPTLAALPRTEMGKATSHLRKAGRIPAVVFGHGESTSVSVDAHEFELLRRRAGANALIDLEVEGGRTTPVVINGVQLHRVHRTPLHVDLFRVKMTEDMTVDVVVHGIGESEAVTKEGGTLLHAVDHVRVRARPDHLPKFIEVDVATLTGFDSVIAVRDLPVPAGATILNDPDEVIFRVLAPRVAEVEPGVAEPEGAAPAAPAEGAAAVE